MREYERIWTLLGDRQIEDLIDLPLITNPDVLDTLDVFTEIVTAVVDVRRAPVNARGLPVGDASVSSMVIAMDRVLAMCGSPCSPGRVFNTTTRAVFGSAQLGYDLVEKRGLTRYQARTYMNVGRDRSFRGRNT